MTTLKGKNALITGSTSGIGLGIARGLAAAGCNIVLNGFGDKLLLDSLQQDLINDFGVKVAYINADLMKGDAAAHLVEQVIEQMGSCDILVNNAGIQHVSPVDEFPDDKWEAIIALNLSSAFYTTKAALPQMRANGFGRIINIASVHGLVASPYKSAYVAAKHGIVGFTKSTALEVAEEDDVTINSICPGWVNTPLVQKQVASQAAIHGLSEADVIKNVMMEQQPKKRFVEVEELAALAVFLCGPAAKSILGANFPMDGAWSAR